MIGQQCSLSPCASNTLLSKLWSCKTVQSIYVKHGLQNLIGKLVLIASLIIWIRPSKKQCSFVSILIGMNLHPCDKLSESKWALWVGPVSVHSVQKRGTCAGLNFVSVIDGKRCHWFTLANSHTFPCRWCFPWCVDLELGQVTRLAKRRWGMRRVCGACQQQHKLLEVCEFPQAPSAPALCVLPQPGWSPTTVQDKKDLLLLNIHPQLGADPIWLTNGAKLSFVGLALKNLTNTLFESTVWLFKQPEFVYT